jgi:predicted dithiol-disulfide oxidoreductase (DUF899 family)
MDIDVVTRDEWTAARKELLAKEKAFTRARDALSADRRRLPMVLVDKDYRFTGPAGELSLEDLFEGRGQLIVYHMMWLADVKRACPSCSAFSDQIGNLAHLNARGITYAEISRAPYPEMAAFKERMGWTFPWYSSLGSDFNVDYHVSFDESTAPLDYNFAPQPDFRDWERPFDLPGLSVFLRHDGKVFHTYSAYARGLDNLGFLSDMMDLTPLGRQEEWEEPKGRATAYGTKAGDQGVQYHDEY